MYARWQADWPKDRAAIVTPGEEITFGALHERVRRATGWLRGRGIGPGQVIALAMPKGLAFLELNLAALRLGAITLPLNDRYTARELRHPLSDAPADLAVLPDPVASSAPGALPSSGIREALDASDPWDPPEPPLSAPALLLYTSGTTGRPKGVLSTGANLSATVEALHAAWQWSGSDVLLHALPLYHVHGLLVAAYGALRAGATSFWLDPFDAREVLHRLSAGPATVFMGVPTFYSRMLEVQGSYDLRRVRLMTSGSAGLPAAVHRAFEARFGQRIVERYGMTEIGIATTNPLDGERRPGSIGRPLPGVGIRLVDERGQEVGTGAVGELEVRGPAVFSGYHRLPEASAGSFVDGGFRTGDLGQTDPDGYITLVGRRSELIIVGGLNVYPAEIEAVLATCPGVREAAVVGIPDPDLGEIPVAAVAGGDDLDLDQVRAKLREDLSPYKIPRRIDRVDALPRNAMGKVLKSALRSERRPLLPSPAGAGRWITASSWDPSVRDGLERMLTQGGDRPLAALDFDQTCVFGDVSETALAILAERTGRDLVGAYEAECRIDVRRAYVDLVSTLVAGRTEAEVRTMALEALAEGERSGALAIREPMRELVWALHRHGWEVWVVTASAEALVQAAAERLGIHPHRVVGMRSPLGPDGRYGTAVAEPVTYREGKLVALRLAAGRDPIFAAGDSRSDQPMMSSARYALLLDRGDQDLRAEAEQAGWWIQPGERIR